MSIYSLSLNTTVTTTGAAAMDLKAAATNTPTLMEIGPVSYTHLTLPTKA